MLEKSITICAVICQSYFCEILNTENVRFRNLLTLNRLGGRAEIALCFHIRDVYGGEPDVYSTKKTIKWKIQIRFKTNLAVLRFSVLATQGDENSNRNIAQWPMKSTKYAWHVSVEFYYSNPVQNVHVLIKNVLSEKPTNTFVKYFKIIITGKSSGASKALANIIRN